MRRRRRRFKGGDETGDGRYTARMCGRFVLLNPPAEIVRHFALPPELAEQPPLDGLAPRYNLAPTQPAPAVRGEGGRRTCTALRWGLIPKWAKDKSIGARLINARGETAATKPSYRDAYANRRCLVPASGFYEWSKPADGGAKAPHFFHLPETGGAPPPFAFAGLWERWEKGESQPVETFTLLTGEPYPAVAPVHSRSPLIVPPDLYAAWLDQDLRDPAGVAKLVREAQARGGENLIARPVSTAVNSPANEGPELIAAA